MPRPATLDFLRSSKKPVRREVPIVLDSDVADELMEAQNRLELARLRLSTRPSDQQFIDEFDDAEEAVKAAQSKAADHTAVFIFQSIGRQAFEDLVDQHPPTKAQKEEARRAGEGNLTYNPETLPPVLIAASCIQPEMTVQDAKDLWDSKDWNQAELLALFTGALSANSSRRVVDLGKESGLMIGSELSSPTASLLESLTPSS